MFIAVTRLPNGSVYIDKEYFERYTEVDLVRHGYTKVDVPEDCLVSDFNDDLTFSLDKYNERKQKEENVERLDYLQSELDSLSQDMVQMYCGAVFTDAEYRKLRFREIHNEIRGILEKEPRIYQ